MSCVKSLGMRRINEMWRCDCQHPGFLVTMCSAQNALSTPTTNFNTSLLLTWSFINYCYGSFNVISFCFTRTKRTRKSRCENCLKQAKKLRDAFKIKLHIMRHLPTWEGGGQNNSNYSSFNPIWFVQRHFCGIKQFFKFRGWNNCQKIPGKFDFYFLCV